MPIVNCKRCGRIFNKVRRDICQSCVMEETRAFEAVRAFLREHPDSDMATVVEGTGVDLNLIVAMIQDGRLILRDNPNMYYACERCGSPTQTGRYCAQCTKELAETLQRATDDLQRRLNKDKSRGYYSK